MAKAKGESSEPEGKPTRARKKQTAQPASRGLTAGQVAAGAPPAKVERLQQAIEEVGGKVLGTYREPLEGHWHVLANLPIDKVAPSAARSWPRRGLRRIAWAFAAMLITGIPASGQVTGVKIAQPNRWVKIHEQTQGDAVRFLRQAHGGSCFDSRRGRVILFGSDTHGQDWENSPLVFDPVALAWSRVYPFDPPQSYAVTAQGIPVAGKTGDHPWAMHTFGTVVHDPARDEIVVACYPAHMVPGRFTNALQELWPKVRNFPTWTFDLKTSRWRALECEPVHFFPYCAAFDTDRNVVLGHRPDGIYGLSGEPRQWKRLTKKVFLDGWHTNASYDAKAKALVVFGHNENRNDVDAFWPASGEHRLMPTRGPRPPKDQHTPMAFEPEIGRTAVIVDRVMESTEKVSKAVAETWLYDLAADRWMQLPEATLPFGCGMNYNMLYDSHRKCLLLVTGDYGQPTRVWAMRVQL